MGEEFKIFNKKILAGFQSGLLLISLFSFAFIVYSTTPVIASDVNIPTRNSWSGAPTFAKGTELSAGTYTSGSLRGQVSTFDKNRQEGTLID